MKRANKTSLPQQDIDGGVVLMPMNVIVYYLKRAILIHDWCHSTATCYLSSQRGFVAFAAASTVAAAGAS
jgi:hypothetical protein